MGLSEENPIFGRKRRKFWIGEGHEMEPTHYIGTPASSSEQGCSVLSDASERERGILEAACIYDQGDRSCVGVIHRLFISFWNCRAAA
jgi:hypothetical protein